MVVAISARSLAHLASDFRGGLGGQVAAREDLEAADEEEVFGGSEGE